jgi:hypothetical protein
VIILSLPIVCIPPVLKKEFSFYRSIFTKPQFTHFQHLVTGLIVSPNKTIQEINDAFNKKDQSSLNRFVTQSPWDLETLKKTRIKCIKQSVSLNKKGIFIADESLLHKTGRHMELAGAHRSGMSKKVEWGHMAVNSFYSDSDDNKFPIATEIYVREKDCAKNNIEFKTKRQIAIDELDFAIENGLPVKLAIADAGYEGEDFTQELKHRNIDYIIGTRVSTKISFNRKKRMSIADYLKTITDADFKSLQHKGNTYFYHIKKVSIRGIGSVKLIISYKYGDEEAIFCSITNLKETDENIIKLLVKRWEIECFHRDAKQHLGLEAYQVRLGRGMQVVALAILVAYTLVFLIGRKLKKIISHFRTIGDICRYLQLIAYKGIRWIKRLWNNPVKAIRMLKKLVFVKSAKV